MCTYSATKVWFDHSTYTFVFGVILIRVLFRRTRNVILVGRRWYNFVSLLCMTQPLYTQQQAYSFYQISLTTVIHLNNKLCVQLCE